MKGLETFITDYPKAFLSPFYFDCNDGWYNILSPVISYIHLYNTNNPGDPIEIIQIKEKFGTLRFYTDRSTNLLSALIEEAEELSEKTCDICGKEGELRGGGWLRTLCDEHDSQRKK